MTISTTPTLALPWPNNDEPVTNGWDAVRDLAVALDAHLATPYYRGEAQANQAIPTANWTMIDHVQVAARGCTEAGGLVTCPRAGVYLLHGTARWSGSAAGFWRKLGVYVNGALVNGSVVAMPPNGNGVTMEVSAIVTVAAAQTVGMAGYQDSGGNLDVNINAAERSSVQVAYLGPS